MYGELQLNVQETREISYDEFCRYKYPDNLAAMAMGQSLQELA